MQNPFIHIQNMLNLSSEEAAKTKCPEVTVEHIMLGFMRPKDSQMAQILKQGFSIDPRHIMDILYAQLSHVATSEDVAKVNQVQMDPDACAVLRDSVKEAFVCDNSPFVEPKHVLLSILKQGKSNVAHMLLDAGITYDRLKNFLMGGVGYDATLADSTGDLAHLTGEGSDATTAIEERDANVQDVQGAGYVDEKGGIAVDERTGDDPGDLLDPDEEPLDLSGNAQPQGKAQQTGHAPKKTKSNTPTLDKYCHNLTDSAAKGKLDPVVGRSKEIQRVMEILGRRKKNNPVLIGEPGVGKSAIVEGLALLIQQQQCPPALFNHRIMALDLAALVAGTKYRGEFEQRIHNLLKELRNNQDVILFVDEIHNMIGAGGAEGAMDTANILKPALARGEIQCVGATTLDEYRKSIEKDGALERRFQKVIVDPTTPEETLAILHNIKHTYERYHKVNYTDEALDACVKLADRYMSDRFFPDKAIDIIDEVGSRISLANSSVPADILEMEAQLKEIDKKKHQAVTIQNFEMAAALRDKQAELEKKLDERRQDWRSGDSGDYFPVTVDDVTSVVSQMTGVPVQRMAESETSRLKELGKRLKAEVIAQDDAVDKMVKAIQRNRMGLRDPNHPIGVFMFLGPTGVGKTYLAKKLAEEMFGDANSMIRIDMSEYAESFNTSRLVGAPPGYVGYNEGGQLSEKVRRKPYSIVLLDEIEKANGNVFNMLLQVLDEGRLTDGNGRLVDFRNTVIIMTSNAGTRQLKDFGKGIGFKASGISDLNHMSESDKEYARSVVQKSLAKQFAPEFLNRLDEIITFDQLSLDAIKRIVDLELHSLVKRINDMGYGFQITEKAKEFVATKGYDVQFGARPLKRAIQTYIEDGLCELLMSGKVKSGDTISVGKCPGKDGLTFK